MSLIHVDSAGGPNQFQIKVGDAALYFEKRRLWEEGRRRAVVCVRASRSQQVILLIVDSVQSMPQTWAQYIVSTFLRARKVSHETDSHTRKSRLKAPRDLLFLL